MSLSRLLDKTMGYKVVLLYTPSNSMSLYVQDRIRQQYSISKDSIMEIHSARDLNQTREVYNVVPFFSERWLFHVPVSDKIIRKNFLTMVKENTSGVYLLEFDTYRSYIMTKKMLGRERGVLDLYLGWLRRADMQTLYGQLVLSKGGYELTQSLFNFVSSGYAMEIESVFKLFNHLADKQEVKNRKDIVAICGISSNNVDNFMFSLLKDPPKTTTGLKRYVADRINEAVELSDKYTWRTFRNYLLSSVKTILDVKLVLSSGEVYDNLKAYHNENYDLKRLHRYQRHLGRIKEISTNRLVGLLEHLNMSVWGSDVDFLTFFFGYMTYKYESNEDMKTYLLESIHKQQQKKKQKELKARDKAIVSKPKPKKDDYEDYEIDEDYSPPTKPRVVVGATDRRSRIKKGLKSNTTRPLTESKQASTGVLNKDAVRNKSIQELFQQKIKGV